jgi:hypothetical protein
MVLLRYVLFLNNIIIPFLMGGERKKIIKLKTYQFKLNESIDELSFFLIKKLSKNRMK